ncbi:MAG: hypothetical protein HZB34_05975 [Nitrospirae bacterium]|nr:hypothetical protein [Nitrospirota bacterium]
MSDFTADSWPTWTYDCTGASRQREILCARARVIVRWLLRRGATMDKHGPTTEERRRQR